MPLPNGTVRKLIGINFKPAARAELSATRIEKMNTNRQKYGCDGRLPDTYGMTAEKLIALLNEWRTRHAGT